MRWFASGRVAQAGPSLEGDGLLLRPPQPGDHAAWARLRGASRTFLTPWEPLWPTDDLTAASFRRRLVAYAEEAAKDEAHHFFIFEAGAQRLVGGLTLGDIKRGVSQTGTLGYWMGEAHAGKGNMTRAVRLVVSWGFQHLGLHRIEAACLLGNLASARLLEKNGFTYEGEARGYLRINGAWQDHKLFALLAGDPVPPAALARK